MYVILPVVIALIANIEEKEKVNEMGGLINER